MKDLTEVTDELKGKIEIAKSRRLTSEEYAALLEEKRRASSICDPDCPFCEGQGYIRRPDVSPFDRDFGTLIPCPNNIRRHLTSGEDPRYGLTGEKIVELNWELVLTDPKISDGYLAKTAVKKALEQGFGLVYLEGGSGQAKSLVCQIAVAVSLRSGIEAAYADMGKILKNLRASFDQENQSQTELIRRSDWWQSLRVLAIDEIDKVSRTPFAEEEMHTLIDRRWQQAIREETLTIVASNEPASFLSKYIASRFHDNRFKEFYVILDGPDGRLSMPKGHRY